MRKLLYTYAIVSAVVLCMTLGALPGWAQDIVFDLDAFSTLQRPVVNVFDHDGHIDYDEIGGECSLCHHVYEDGQLIEDEDSAGQPCSDCHDLKAQGNAPGLRTAYHQQCKGCHIDLKQGPVACGQCHIQ